MDNDDIFQRLVLCVVHSHQSVKHSQIDDVSQKPLLPRGITQYFRDNRYIALVMGEQVTC